MIIQITVDDAEINPALNNLVHHINNLQPAMDSIGEALLGLIQEQLDALGRCVWTVISRLYRCQKQQTHTNQEKSAALFNSLMRWWRLI